jgi:stage IV sporulation protein A
MPRWVNALGDDYWLKSDMLGAIRETFRDVRKVREIKSSVQRFQDYDFIKKATVDRINLGEGNALIELDVVDGLFYRILSETSTQRCGSTAQPA